jgi:hypothetical protein
MISWAKGIRLIFAYHVGGKSTGDCTVEGARDAKLLFYKGRYLEESAHDKNAKAKRRPHYVPAT